MDNLFLIVFSVFLSTASIYSFIKKKYIYVFIPAILFLPNYYGLEFSGSLPVFTVSRIMFIWFYVYVFINRKHNISLKEFNIKRLSKPYLMLLGYFVLRIISNLFYITTYNDALKTIFSILFEELFLLVGLYLLAPGRDEIDTTIKSIVWSASAFFVFGILESLTSKRLFDELFTISRPVNNIHSYRLGLLRATTTMGFPNIFGNMCLLVFPLIIYLLKKTRNKVYLLCIVLNFLAILHSGCRSDLIWFILLSFIYLLHTFITEKQNFKRTIKYTITIIAVTTLWLTIASIVNDNLNYFYTGTFKSVLNIVGFNFDLEANKPEGVRGFGTNQDGVLSRTAQFSGIVYTLSKSPVFGLGNGFQNRGDIYYYYIDRWKSIKSVDLGLVEIIGAEGLLGLAAFFLLFGSFLLILLSRRKKHEFPTDSRTCFFLPFVYLLCTLSASNMMTFLILTAALLFYDLKTVF